MIIAHRGNLYGPNRDTENTFEALTHAISNGFDVEVDLRVYNQKYPYFSHDLVDAPYAKYNFDSVIKYIEYYHIYMWFHCKEPESFKYMMDTYPDANYFCHDTDMATFTSKGFQWIWPRTRAQEEIVGNKAIHVVTNNLSSLQKLKENKIHGICTDYPFAVKEMIKNV